MEVIYAGNEYCFSHKQRTTASVVDLSVLSRPLLVDIVTPVGTFKDQNIY